MRSGFRCPSFSFRLAWFSDLPGQKESLLAFYRVCSRQDLHLGRLVPFLIAFALSALRWAWTGLKFFSFAIVVRLLLQLGDGL